MRVIEGGLAFIDARTGLPNPAWVVIAMDVERESLCIVDMSQVLAGTVTERWVRVPKIVVDVRRLTVTYNVQHDTAPDRRRSRRIDEPTPIWT